MTSKHQRFMSNTTSSQPLDDVLLAMDVVDTLRHQEDILARELDASARKDKLIRRLREIYDAQGIKVPDHVLEEGVKALEEQRFVYTPPKPSLSVALAKAYIARDRWIKPVAGVIAALIVALGGYQFGIAGPAKARAAAERVQLTETLPADLERLRQAIETSTEDRQALILAETFYQDGIAAVAGEKARDARAAVKDLEQLQTDLALRYEVTIVSRPGEQSGVYRIPDNVPGGRNYYLIVEAIGPRGNALPVTIRSEEDQATKRVTRWGQRVPEAVYNQVRADKQDDQIVQDAVIGLKQPGQLEPLYTVETLGGAILEW